MDRPIDPQVRRKAQMIRYGIVAGLAVAAVLYVVLRDGGSRMNVDRAKVTIERVRHEGIFNGTFGRVIRDNVYAVGNSVDANEIVRTMLGRDADPDERDLLRGRPR